MPSGLLILGHRDSCHRRFNSRESFQRFNELKVDVDAESTLISSLVEFVVLELRHETVIFEISMPAACGLNACDMLPSTLWYEP